MYCQENFFLRLMTSICLLCGPSSKSLNHLLFYCSYALSCWHKIFGSFNILSFSQINQYNLLQLPIGPCLPPRPLLLWIILLTQSYGSTKTKVFLKESIADELIVLKYLTWRPLSGIPIPNSSGDFLCKILIWIGLPKFFLNSIFSSMFGLCGCILPFAFWFFCLIGLHFVIC